MRLYRLLTKHPVTTAVSGAALVGGSIATCELFPHREDTRREDAALCAGLLLAIGGGTNSLFKARRVRGRVFGGLIASGASLLAAIATLAFFFGEEGEQ